ncbi:MAG: hypothetical protein R2704_16840 [Microthrixaceae bacterium]
MLMPPWMPPDRLAATSGRPSAPGTNGSLWVLPVIVVPAKPEPTSNPLAAGSDMHAAASVASSLSNTGSPSPAGTPRAMQVTTPPRLSP